MTYTLNSVFDLLNDDNTIHLNRFLNHAIGLNENVIYNCLISKYYYYSTKKPEQVSDGWFYSTVNDLWESTSLQEKAQRRAINELVKYGLIEVMKKGIPQKRYFRITNNLEQLSNLISKGREISKEIKDKENNKSENVGKNVTVQILPNGGNEMAKRRTSSAQTAELNPPKRLIQKRPNGGNESAQTADSLYYNHNRINHNVNNHQSINHSAAEAERDFENSQNPEQTDGHDGEKRKTNNLSFREVISSMKELRVWETDVNSEEDYMDCNEIDRRTEECVIPYSFIGNRQAIETALKFIFAYSYRFEQGTFDELEKNFVDTVIGTLTAVLSDDKKKSPISRNEIIDYINKINKESSMIEWTMEWSEKYSKIMESKRNRNKNVTFASGFFTTCMINFLKPEEYKLFARDQITDMCIYDNNIAVTQTRINDSHPQKSNDRSETAELVQDSVAEINQNEYKTDKQLKEEQHREAEIEKKKCIDDLQIYIAKHNCTEERRFIASIGDVSYQCQCAAKEELDEIIKYFGQKGKQIKHLSELTNDEYDEFLKYWAEIEKQQKEEREKRIAETNETMKKLGII